VWTTQKTPIPRIPLLLYIDSLLQKRVYRAVADKRPPLLVPLFQLSAAMSQHNKTTFSGVSKKKYVNIS
jgi:hypothetical protein